MSIQPRVWLVCFSAFCHFLILIMFGSEVGKVPESYVKGSYGILVISMFVELVLPILIHLDKSKNSPIHRILVRAGISKAMPKDIVDASSKGKRPNDPSKRQPKAAVVDMRANPVVSIEDQAAGFRTSTSSLSEAETFKKFAYYENPGVNASTASLSDASSINARSAAYTNTTYLTDRSSLESGVWWRVFTRLIIYFYMISLCIICVCCFEYCLPNESLFFCTRLFQFNDFFTISVSVIIGRLCLELVVAKYCVLFVFEWLHFFVEWYFIIDFILFYFSGVPITISPFKHFQISICIFVIVPFLFYLHFSYLCLL